MLPSVGWLGGTHGVAVSECMPGHRVRCTPSVVTLPAGSFAVAPICLTGLVCKRPACRPCPAAEMRASVRSTHSCASWQTQPWCVRWCNCVANRGLATCGGSVTMRHPLIPSTCCCRRAWLASWRTASQRPQPCRHRAITPARHYPIMQEEELRKRKKVPPEVLAAKRALVHEWIQQGASRGGWLPWLLRIGGRPAQCVQGFGARVDPVDQAAAR